MREPGGAGRRSLTLLLVLLAGCGPLVGSRPGEGPSPSTGALPEPFPPFLPLAGPAPIPDLPLAVRELDPILDSPWARAPELEGEVQRWVTSFQTREAGAFLESLVRMGRYQETVAEELRRRKLPPSLLFLPIVESWYRPEAVSPAGAAGLWQFMAPTARGLGLEVTSLLDERRDPFRSTPQALAYLEELQGQFGSWFLTLAAYNAGPGRLDRILKRRAPEATPHDGLYLQVHGDLPRETREFIPRFLAAARVAGDPVAHGFGDLVPDPPLAFDEVEVPDAISLDVVARAAGADQSAVRSLNPQILRGLTPAGVPTLVRVPPGLGETFSQAYALIPPRERVTFVEHAVARGETLSHIGRLYGVPVAELQAANPRVEPRRMRIGQRIIVPRAPSVRAGAGVTGRVLAEGGAGSPGVVTYRVQPGDSLARIALRHRVPLADLLRWNGLTMSSVIFPGDEVLIHLQGSQ